MNGTNGNWHLPEFFRPFRYFRMFRNLFLSVLRQSLDANVAEFH